jgi:large subunit ribosomal protein L23
MKSGKLPHSIIKHPLSTEKVVRMMESENKLVFIVDLKATKAQIKKELEKMFNIKIIKINTLVTSKGEKKAYVKLSPETPAIDVATQMGLM